jgi:hypothetical protein
MDTSEEPDTIKRDGITKNKLDNGARAGELDTGSPEPTAASVWDLFDEIWSRVPDEELRQLPSDGAEQHDHYLYGLPKKKR